MLRFKITKETYSGDVRTYHVDFEADVEAGCEGLESFSDKEGALENEFTTRGDALNALRIIRHRIDEAIKAEEAKAEPEIVGTVCMCDLCLERRKRGAAGI